MLPKPRKGTTIQTLGKQLSSALPHSPLPSGLLPRSGQFAAGKWGMSQAGMSLWVRPPSDCPWLCTGKNSRAPRQSESRFIERGTHSIWSRKWQPTPVFFPEKSHGQRSLLGYSPRDRAGHDSATEHARTRAHIPQAACDLPGLSQKVRAALGRGSSGKMRAPPDLGWLVFYGLGDSTGQRVGGLLQLFGGKG